MLSRTTLAVVGCLAACALLAMAFLEVRRRNGQSRAEVAELRESVALLRSELGKQRRADALESLAPMMPGDAGGRGQGEEGNAGVGLELEDGDAADAKAGSAAAASGTQPTRTTDEMMQLSEEQFRTEPVDAAWAGESSLSVERTLALITPTGGAVRSLACRSTRCRLEMSLRDEASLESFQREALYGSNVLWRGRMMMTRDAQADGTITMIAHLQR